MVGGLLLIQCKDIPMGIDPTPFWTDLSLYDYDADFISNLIKTHRPTAINFKNSTRYIHNECNLNDSGGFSKSFHAI